MFIPGDNGKTFSLHLKRSVFRVLLIIAVLFTLGMIGLVYKAGEIAIKLQMVYVLRDENEKLRKNNKDLFVAVQKIENIETISRYIQKISRIYGDSLAGLLPIELAERQSRDLFLNDTVETAFDNLKLFGRNSTDKNKSAERGSSDSLLLYIPNSKPVEGWQTKEFALQSDSSEMHLGLDFAAALGTVIMATAPGIVEDVKEDKYLGLTITIRHGSGFVTRYGHCEKALLTKGAPVARGEGIALVGNTGRSSAPHLHYEVHKDGENVNPMDYMGEHIE